jgi:hypothetical protein
VRGTRRGGGRVRCQILRRSSGGREVKSGNVGVEVEDAGFGCGADVSGNEVGCGDASECEVGIEFAYEGEG